MKGFRTFLKSALAITLVVSMLFGSSNVNQLIDSTLHATAETVQATEQAGKTSGDDTDTGNKSDTGNKGNTEGTGSSTTAAGGSSGESTGTGNIIADTASHTADTASDTKTETVQTTAETAAEYKVTFSCEPRGAAVIDGAFSIAAGSDYTFTLTPAKGEIIEKVTVNGAELNAASRDDTTRINTYTVTKVQSDLQIDVTAADSPDKSVTLTAQADGKYNVTVSGTKKALGRAVSMKASVIPEDRTKQLVASDDTIPDDFVPTVGIDVRLFDKDGNEVEPDGEVSVDIEDIVSAACTAPDGEAAGEEKVDDSDICAYHITDNSTEEISPEINGDDVSLKSDHFSPIIFGFKKAGLLGGANLVTSGTLTGTVTWPSDDAWKSFTWGSDTANSSLIKLTVKADGSAVDTSAMTWTGVTGNVWTYSMPNVSYTSSLEVSFAMNTEKTAIVYTASPVSDPAVSGDTITMGNISPVLSTTTLKIDQTIVSNDTETATAFTYNLYVSPDSKPYASSVKLTKQIKVTGTPASSVSDTLPVGAYYEIQKPASADYTGTLTSASGTDCAKLTGTQAAVSYSWQKLTAFTPSVVWLDNNDFAGKRPTATADVVPKLYCSKDDGVTYEEVTNANYADFGLSSLPKPVITVSGAYWTYNYGKLPSTKGSTSLKFAMKVSASDTSSVTDNYILPADTYITDKADAVYKTNFKGTIAWKDTAVKETVRPSSVSLALYKVVSGSTEPAIVKTIAVSGNNTDTTWNISIADLPAYDEKGAIVYYVTETTPVSKDSSTASYIAATYDNSTGKNGDKTEGCYDGGTIVNSITGNKTFTAYKQWHNASKTKPDDLTGTVYLWRYTDTDGHDFMNGSQATLTQDANADIIKQTLDNFSVISNADDAYVTDASYKNNTVKYEFTGLPAYDINGNKYIYFAVERLSGAKETVYDNSYDNTLTSETAGAADNSNFKNNAAVLFDHGIIKNYPSQDIDITASKTWIAASMQDKLANTKVTLTLVRRIKGTSDYTYVNSENNPITINGFTASSLTQGVDFGKFPRYDTEGNEYEYLVNETISSDLPIKGKTASAGTYTSDTIENGGTYILNEGQFAYTASYTLAADADTCNKSTTALVQAQNKLSDTVSYTVQKVWQGDTEANRPDSITVYLSRTGYETADATETKTTTVTETLNKNVSNNTEWGNAEGSYSSYTWKDQPKYDARGYAYVYRVDEGSVTNKLSATDGGKAYHRTISYAEDTVAKKVTATITNKLYQPGNSAVVYGEKIWHDGGNEAAHLPVTLTLARFNTSTNAITDYIDTSNNKLTWTLTNANGWYEECYFDPTRYATGTGEVYYLYESKVGDITPHVTSTNYDGTAKTITTTATYTYNNVDYKSVSVYDINTKKAEITNTRTGTFSYKITKAWKDGGVINSKRPQMTIALYSADAPVKQPGSDTYYTYTSGDGTTGANIESTYDNASSTDPMITFKNIPRYDDLGNVINYTVKETMNDTNTPTYSSTWYKSSFGKNIYDEVTKTETVKITNTATGDEEPTFYKKWTDNNNAESTRSDIFLTLYRSVTVGGKTYLEKTKNQDYLAYKPSTGVNGYDWEYLFNTLPKFVSADMVNDKETIYDNVTDTIYHPNADNTSHVFTENDIGNPITYYISETMNVPGEYKQRYYSGAPTINSGVYTWSAQVAGTKLLQENGLLENYLDSYMTLNGVKQWTNLPTGLAKADVLNGLTDKITFILYKKDSKASDYTPMTLEDADIKKYSQNGTYDALRNTSKQIIAKLKADTAWNCTFAFEDTNGNLLQLPKYDENGGRMHYKACEFTADGSDLGNVFQIIYPDSYNTRTDFAIENSYKETATGNLKKITVTKNWGGLYNNKNGNTVYPTVTFVLYQFAPGKTDGEIKILSNGVKYASHQMTGNAATDTYTFDSVPIYAPNGEKYIYTVGESITAAGTAGVYDTTAYITPDSGAGTDAKWTTDSYYFVKAADVSTDNGVTFNNTYKAIADNNITLAGSKKWTDWGASTGSRPSTEADAENDIKIKITRKAGTLSETFEQGTDFYTKWTMAVESSVYYPTSFVIDTLSGSDDSGTKKLWERYATNGIAYTYYITDTCGTTYGEYTADTVSASASGKTNNSELNVGEINNTLGTTFTTAKGWDDDNNKLGMRPSKVTVKLQYTVSTDQNAAIYSDGNVGGADWTDINTTNGTVPETYGMKSFSSTATAAGYAAEELNSGNLWKFTFTDLPKSYTTGGTTYYYHYRTVETAVGDITTSRTSDSKTYFGSYLVNTPTGAGTPASPYKLWNQLQGVSLTVKKNWADNQNEFNVRPVSLTVYLKRTTTVLKTDGTEPTDGKYVFKADGTTYLTQTLTGTATADSWTTTFTGLPATDNEGKNYHYYAVEYVPTGEGTTDKVLTIGTNTSYSLTSEKYESGLTTLTNTINNTATVYRSLTVHKAWSDSEQQDGGRPTSVTVELKYKTSAAGSVWTSFSPAITATLSADTKVSIGGTEVAWAYKWDKLPVYDVSGNTISYEVTETNMNANNPAALNGENGSDPIIYTPAYTYYSDDAGSTNQSGTEADSSTKYIKVTNTHTPVVMSVGINKTWKSDDTSVTAGDGLTAKDDSTWLALIRPSLKFTLQTSSDNSTWADYAATGVVNPVTITSTGNDASGSSAEKSNAYSKTWAKTKVWQNLPVYTGGKLNHYRVVESAAENITNKYSNAENYTSASLNGSSTSTALTASLTNTLPTTTAGFTKKWEDGSNASGIRSSIASVQVKLQYRYATVADDSAWSSWADTGRTQSISVTSDNSVSGEFKALPRYTNTGMPFEYRAVETSFKLTTAAGGATISETGTRNEKTSGFTAGQISDVSGGILGAYDSTEDTAAIAENDGSDKYYSCSTVITNTLKTRPLFVKKLWSDGNDQDGLRPYAVEMTVSYSGYTGKALKVKLDGTSDTAPADGSTGYESDAWTGKWAAVPVNDANGNPVSYHVSETGFYQNATDGTPTAITAGALTFAVQGTYYTSNGGGTATGTHTGEYTISQATVTETSPGSAEASDNALTITDTHTPDTVDVTAVKTWEDTTSFWEQLKYDWSWLTRPELSLTLQYKYPDEADTAYDTQGRSAVLGIFTRLTNVNEHSYTWSGKPKYYTSGGKTYEIQYRVLEGDTKAYTHNGNGVFSDTSNTSKSLTNTMNTVSYSVTKKWEGDHSNVASTRRDMTLTLQYREVENINDTSATEWFSLAGISEAGSSEDIAAAVKYTADSSQVITFTNLPSKDKNGKYFQYRAVETAVPGYNVSYSYASPAVYDNAGNQSGDVITNTLNTVSVKGKKVWDDNSNTSGHRPDAITITVQNSSTHIVVKYGSDQLTWTKNGNNWDYEITGLPKCDDTGAKITYEVKENNVPGYVQTSPASGSAAQCTKDAGDTVQTAADMTNKLNEITITGTKNWSDNSNAEGIRPADNKSVLIVKANGTQITVPDADITWTAGSGNTAGFSINNLPRYDMQGTAIAYTVTDEAAGYNASCTNDGSVDSGSGNITGVQLTNTIKYGGIKIAKKLSSGTPTTLFTLKLTYSANGSAEQPYKGRYYIYNSSDDTLLAPMTDDPNYVDNSGNPYLWSRDGTMQIKSDCYIRILQTDSALPAGATYKVSEVSMPSGYRMESQTGATGVVPDTGNAEVTVTNGLVPAEPSTPSVPSTHNTPSEPETPVTPKTPKKPKVPVNPLNPDWNPPVPLDPAKPYTDTYVPVDPSHYPGIIYNSTGDVIREAAEGFSNKGVLVFDKEYKGALYDASGKMVRGARRGYNVDGTRASTGDSSGLELWLILMLTSGGAIIMVRNRKKKEQK